MGDRKSDIYSVSVAYIFLEKGEGMRETNLKILFKDKNEKQAIISAIAWAKNRLPIMQETYEKAEIGSIKVRHYYIGIPEKDGYIPTKSGFPFFEWKIDFPESLENVIARMVK